MRWFFHRRRARRDAGTWAAVPIDQIRCSVLDCETTGLEPHHGDRLVSIAAVSMERGELTDREFGSLINPGRSIPAEATRIHGIDDAMVAQAPTPREAVAGLRDFVGDFPVVGHLIAFDLAFLNPVARRAHVPAFPLALDTLLMSTVLWPERGVRHGLDAVTDRLGIDVVDRHTARGDAVATAYVFAALVPMMQERGLVTIGDVVSACQATPRAVEFAKRYRR